MSNVSAKVTADSSGFQRAMQQAVQSMKELSSEYSLASTSAKLFGTAQEALKSKTDELRAKIAQQTDIVKLNEQQQGNLAKELQKHKEAQEKLKSEIASTEAAIKKSTEETGKNSKETKELKEKLAELKKEEKEASESVEMVEKELSKQTVTTNKSKETLEKMRAELEKTNKELKESKWNEFAKNAEAATQVLDDVGKKLSVVSGVIVGMGTVAIKTTAQFDSQMSTVQSISGATGDQFEDLRDKAVEMGSKTSFSASEAGKAMEYMAMAGWTTQDMLDGISGVMAAAAASGEELAATSDILTDGLTAFGMSAADSAHFADVLVKAGNSANTSVSMMGETFKYAGAVCGTLGISIEDAAIATGLMGNAGIKASNAGTALRGGLTNLVKPTKEMAAAMNEYGIEIVKSSDGSVDFMGTMKNLRQNLSGLDSTTQAAAISTIFGKEAMSGWAAIVNASEKDFGDLTDAIYNCDGAAQEAADIKLDNLSGQITILKSTIEGITIQIGDILMPTVRKVVGVIQEWATRFSELDESAKKQIVTIGAVVAAIGPAILAFSGVLKAIMKIHDIAGKIPAIMKAVQGAFGLLSGPVGIAVAAIALLTAAFIHLWRTNEDFRNAITQIWGTIKETIETFIEEIRGRMGGLTEAFGNVATVAGAIWNGFCELLAPVFTGVFQYIADTLSAACDIIMGIMDIFTGVFTGEWSLAWSGVKEIFGAVWGWVQSVFQNKLETIKGVANAFLGWFGTNWNQVWSAVSGFFRGIWDGITSALSEAWQTIKNVVQVGIMFVEELINAAVEIIMLPWTFLWENFHEPIEKAWEVVKTTVTAALDAVGNAIGKAWDKISTVTSTAWNAVKAAVEGPINTAKETVSKAVSAAKEATSAAWNATKSATSTAWNAIKSAVSTPINAVKSTVTSVVNSVKSAVTSAWNAIKTATSTTWNAIKTAISTPINGAISVVQNAIDRIKSAFNFSWSFPPLKLPHISISGSFSINPPSVPHFSISWYKNGGIMIDPTMFGMAGSTALAGGEAGPEAILPLRPFYERLAEILDEKLTQYAEAVGMVVCVYCYIDGDEVATRTATKVSKRMAEEARRTR